MPYRICKSFTVESGHMLSKHPGRCRFPHGHTRAIDVVVSAAELDASDMVCDFAALKHAIAAAVDRFDHALAINSDDPLLAKLESVQERIVIFQGKDPTTEVFAKFIFDELESVIAARRSIAGPDGRSYVLPAGLRVERVRVGETPTTWAEYAR